MQITLNQDELLDAVETYVRQQINVADGQKITIDLKAGRGDNGHSATLDIRPDTGSKPKKAPTRSKAPEPVEEKTEEAKPASQTLRSVKNQEEDEQPPIVEEDEDTPDTGAEIEDSAEEPEEKQADKASPAPSKKSIFSKAG